MNDTKKTFDATVEQVCERLQSVRNEMIGDEGEVITVSRMKNVEIYGMLDGETVKYELAPDHVFAVLEIPVGEHFPVVDNGIVPAGFDLRE